MTQQEIFFRKKYADSVYDASTPELLARACALELRERNSDGYFWREYGEDMEMSEEDEEILALSEENLAKLPTAIKLRDDVAYRRTALISKRRSYDLARKAEDEWFSALRAVLDVEPEKAYLLTTKGYSVFGSREVPLAYAIVKTRQEYDHEDYCILAIP